MSSGCAGAGWEADDRWQSPDQEKEKKEALLQLCHANGIREEDISRPERVTHIEMVLDDYCCMGALKYFVNLKSVCLIQQAIVKIEGLESSPDLEKLVLNENKISKIEGLGSCHRLKSLYLCTNAITELGTGLGGLRQLELLWICENLLGSLRGLELAPSLTELNAARNNISTVVNAFQQNQKLAVLNLADNHLAFFHELLDVAKLPNLKEVNFADPDWGENPLCRLNNYRTCVLFHMPTLKVHDRMRISQEEHQAAETSFAKKRLYYNMRIKLVVRCAADCLKASKTLEEERVTELRSEFEATAKDLKRVAAAALCNELGSAALRLTEDNAEGVSSDTMTRKQAACKIDMADASMALDTLSKDIERERDSIIQSLQLELQTGGNIRLEPGNLERDAWAQHVAELVRNRVKIEDLLPYGISDVKVLKVSKVHNQALRLRFEEQLERVQGDVRQQLDYLFYVPNPRHVGNELQSMIETGIDGGDGEVALVPLLTNSFSVIEVPRLDRFASSPLGKAQERAAKRAARLQREATNKAAETMSSSERLARALASCSAGVVVCNGKLLLCSVYLHDQQPDAPDCLDAKVDARLAWSREPSVAPMMHPNEYIQETGGGQTNQVELPWPVARHRSRIDDPKQKVWCVPQADAILPEFLVEFEYVYRSETTQSNIPPRQEEHGPFASLFQEFAYFLKLGIGTEAAKDPSKDDETKDIPVPSAASPRLERLEEHHLTKGPLAPLDVDMLGKVQALNLHGLRIRRFDPTATQRLVNLTTLLLSFNAIESIGSLPQASSLTRLDVSFNLLQNVSTLNSFPHLQNLDLSWNTLLSLDVLDTLAKDTPNIEELNLAGNKLGSKYRASTILQLKNLKMLDEKKVSKTELADAAEHHVYATELTEAVLQEHSYIIAKQCFTSTGTEGTGPLHRSRLSSSTPADGDRCVATLFAGASIEGNSSGAASNLCVGGKWISQLNWRSHVEVVNLRGCKLAKLCDLSRFSQVWSMNLASNCLTSLQELASCSRLEELSVEQNSLTSLHGLAELHELRRLDAACNQISDVLALNRMTKLTHLSLEDNYIDSLDVFCNLNHLVELYVSNNLIEDQRSVLMVKHLPRLVILDLSGNDLCSAQDYRLYTLFHLRKLKVLDGVVVTLAELQAADDQFSGRITMELLEDKLGPSMVCYNFRTVDLSNQGIKELGHLLTDDIFPSLRELSLDGNPFTDMRKLGPLSKLVVLRMNRTRIDLENGMLSQGEGAGGIASLRHLQVLEMGSSGISDISFFSQFPLRALRVLHLPGNDITRVEGLSHLEQLRELVLDRNKVKQFDEKSLEGLRSLRELRVEDNGLKSLAHLGPLPRLRALYLSSNRIAELSELEKLRGLSNVVSVYLVQNPVARKPLYRSHVIHAMGSVKAIDGKEVTEDERDKMEQLLVTSDPSKQMGQGIYYLSEQQPANPLMPLGYGAPPIVSLLSGPPAASVASSGPSQDIARRSIGIVETGTRGAPVRTGRGGP